MANPRERAVLGSYRTGALMVAGGLDLGLIGLLVVRFGSQITGVALAAVGIGAALYYGLRMLGASSA